MKFNCKLRIIVTAITMVTVFILSGTAFAEWTINVPGALGTNIVDSVATSKGMVAVGQDGKLYSMSTSSMSGTPNWELLISPVTDDFAGVAYDGSKYWAVSVTGKIITSTQGSVWKAVSVPTKLQSVIAENVVGIAAADGKAFIVTSAGGLLSTDGTDWKDYSSELKKASLASGNNIKGLKIFSNADSKWLAIFGHGGLCQFDLDGETLTTETTFSKLNDINDLVINAHNDWIIVGGAGGSGKIFAGTDFAKKDSLTAISVKDSSGEDYNPADILSVYYDSTEKAGFACGQAGLLLQIKNDGSSYSATYVPQTTTTENLNTVASADAKKVFASGNNGASIYGKEVYWTKTSSIPGTNSASALISGDGKYIGVFKNISDEPTHFNAYVTTDKGASWKVASGGITEPSDEGKFVKKDGKDYFVSKTASDKLQIVTLDTDVHDSTGDELTYEDHNYASYAVLGSTIYAFARNNAGLPHYDIQAADPDSTGSAAAVETNIESGKISACGATAKALYVLTTDNKFMAMVDDDNHLTAELSGKFVEVEAFKYLLSTISEHSLSLYSATDGTLILIDTTAGNLCIIYDSSVAAKTDVSADASNYASSVRNLPGSSYDSPKFSGSSSYLAYSQGSDVYMFSDWTWSKYEGNEKEPSYIASSGSGIMFSSMFPGPPFYSEGAKFGNVLASTVASPDNSFMYIYNASKTDVYVGSYEGSYHGTVKADTGSVVWDSERVGDGIIGTSSSYVFGSGDEVYAIYEVKEEQNQDAMRESTSSFAYNIARKTSDSWEKLELTGENKLQCNMAIAAGDGVIYCIDSSGLYKGTINESRCSFIEQTASTDGDKMPTSLGLIAASPSGDVIYGASGSHFYKFSENSGDVWKVEEIDVQDKGSSATLNWIMCLSSDKIYIVGDSGYAALYDGKTVTRFEKPSSENLNSCWAYADKLYAAGDEGKVYEYDLESKKWSSSIIASGSWLSSICGSSAGGYLLVAGENGVLKSTHIEESGSGETSTEVQNGQGEPADLVVESHHLDDSVTKLTKDYHTPDMTMIGLPEVFKTKPIVPASVHSFKYSVTPAADIEVNRLILFKLLSASGSETTGSNIKYSRVNAVPTTIEDGTFWITDNSGKAMVSGESLKAGTVYAVNFAIKDGGKYDLDKTVNGVIEDPAVLGASSGSDGSSSGCVFNPAQSMSLEWILLLLVPMLASFRSRFKR